jgi:hypothetical protein
MFMSAIKLGLLATLAVFAACVAMASSASADCYFVSQNSAKYKGISGTRCIEPLEPSDGKYQEAFADWAFNGKVLTEAVAVDSETPEGVTLTDMKGGIFGEEVTVKCSITDKGTVGSGSAGKETEVTATSCTTTKGICMSPSVVAVDLPWNTRLHETTKDRIEEDEKGNPGYEVTCSSVKDTCTGASMTSIKNLAKTETKHAVVDLEFTKAIAEAEPDNCSRGGEKQGLLIGRVLLLAPSGDLAVTSE